jgi:Family of unknown function (DUF6279)
MNGFLRGLLFGLVVLAASGCSVKFAYNNLDRLARWEVSEYVDFDERQAIYFDAEFARLMYWHRTQELPRYADWLESLATATSEERVEATLDRVVSEAIASAELLERKALPMTVELMVSLSDAQVQALPKRFEKANAELVEDEVGLDTRAAQERWHEDLQDGARRFMGRLTDEQINWLKLQSVRYQPELVQWAEYRKRWQARLMAMLATRSDADAFASAYERLLNERETLYGPEFKAVSKSNETLRRDVVLGLLLQANERQTERLIESMREFALDFRTLSAEAPPQEPPSGGCLVRCAGKAKG